MIYTFYSYKGGVGRSMALANVAELFYQAGLKVLMLDWDLEAPGLERFFPIDYEDFSSRPGLMDMLLSYKQQMTEELNFAGNNISGDKNYLPFEKPEKYLFDIYPTSKSKGKLWLLSAGKRSKQNFIQYANSVRNFDWGDFYQNWEGELYFEWLRQQFGEIADVVLIDSRTGVTEMGGVCTYQLADVVVMLCSASQQSLEGTHKMLLDFKRPEVMQIRNRFLDVIVVPARVEDAESDYLDAFQKEFIKLFSEYTPRELGSQPDRLWQLSIPYVSRYAYKEVLAIPEQGKAHAQKLVEAFSKLAASLSVLAEKDSPLRQAMPESKIEIGKETLSATVVNQGLVVIGNTTYIEKNNQPQVRYQSFFAYDNAWVGREDLIKDLSNRIRTSCRLLILVGITGVGKTSLGERLAVELEEWFGNNWEHFHQENFDDEQQSSDFTNVAARWLEKWDELITSEERKDPQRLLLRLVRYLCENRYLVQMDSLENILQGNEGEGWSDFRDEWWIKFFDSYLKAESCQSCIILTSQDLPGQIEAIGTRSPNFWYCQPLSGLEQAERIALFEKTGLDISPTSDGKLYLERIGAAYEGHPLALRVIAGEINNKPFEGNVIAYWNKYGNEVEQVEKAIAEAQEGKSAKSEDKWQLDRFTKTLRINLRSRLDKTFKRLRENAKWAYILLCEASVYRCPVPEDFWLSHLEDWDRGEDEQKTALELLRSYSLVEEIIDRNQVLLRQHNLIRSLALEHLSHLEKGNE